ncbi:MAG: hypothetical protein UY99_C0017G0008 [Parcubacteria group bacterium GW2011_GWA1_59_11]|nr:MAG: hypothetical protein UY99_C0017G0008 [Parcubacteria group bacterium GW2011_GWA1_59_11]
MTTKVALDPKSEARLREGIAQGLPWACANCFTPVPESALSGVPTCPECGPSHFRLAEDILREAGK